MFSRYIPLDIIKYVLLDYLDEYFIFIEDNLFHTKSFIDFEIKYEYEKDHKGKASIQKFEFNARLFDRMDTIKFYYYKFNLI